MLLLLRLICIGLIFITPFTLALKGMEPLPHQVKATIDLPKDCFTQGFLIHNNHFYLSCGLYGSSRIFIIDHKGKVIKQKAFDKRYFLEAIAIIDHRLYALTWKSGHVFVMDKNSLDIIDTKTIKGEGWGLGTVGSGASENLLVTNGSSHINILNKQWQPMGSMSLIDTRKRPILDLNAMTTIGTMLIINVWKTNQLVLLPFQPNTTLTPSAWIDLSEFNPTWFFRYNGIIANGVTYDKNTDCLWVTGKKWGKAYALSVKLPANLAQSSSVSMQCKPQ